MTAIRALTDPTAILVGDDEGDIELTLPFTFWGETSVGVAANGFLAFPWTLDCGLNYGDPLDAYDFKGIFMSADFQDNQTSGNSCEYGDVSGGGWGVTWTNWGYYAYPVYGSVTFQIVIWPDQSCEINVDRIDDPNWDSENLNGTAMYAGFRPTTDTGYGSSYPLEGGNDWGNPVLYADGMPYSLSANTNAGVAGRWFYADTNKFGTADTLVTVDALADGDAAPGDMTPTVVSPAATADGDVIPRVSPIRALISPTAVLAGADSDDVQVTLPFTFWDEVDVGITADGVLVFPWFSGCGDYYATHFYEQTFKGIFLRTDFYDNQPGSCEYGDVAGGGWGVTWTIWGYYPDYGSATFQIVIWPDQTCEINVDRIDDQFLAGYTGSFQAGFKPVAETGPSSTYMLPGWNEDGFPPEYTTGGEHSLMSNSNVGVEGRWALLATEQWSGADLTEAIPEALAAVPGDVVADALETGVSPLTDASGEAGPVVYDYGDALETLVTPTSAASAVAGPYVGMDNTITVTSEIHLTLMAPIAIPAPPVPQGAPVDEGEGNWSYPSPVYGGVIVRALYGTVVDMDTPSITDGKPS